MYFLFVKSDKLLVTPHIISITRIYYETCICILYIAIIYINKAWRQVSQSTIVNCWRKADILDNMYSIDYSIDLNNDELNIFFKEEIQKVTVDYVKALEKYRKDYVEIEEFDHLDYDFEKYLNCDNDVQTCIDMTDEEIVKFTSNLL